MVMNPTLDRRKFLSIGGALAASSLVGLGGRSGTAFAADVASVRVLNSAGDLGGIMQTMIKDLGLAKQFGLDVEYTNVADGSKINAGLISGDSDICTWSGFSQVFPAVERGASLKIVGGCVSLPTLGIYSAKPEVKSVRDLVGKNIAVGAPGSLLHMLTVAVLRKHGVDENSMQFVSAGSSADSFRALVAGKVDAGISAVDINDQLDKFGLHVLAEGQLWNELPNFTMQAAYATNETIRKKRDVIVRLLALHAKLYRFLSTKESWDAWSSAYKSYLGANADLVRSQTFWNFIQQRQPFATDLVLSEQRFKYIQDMNLSLGIQKKILPYEQVADMSMAAEAVKMLG